MSLPVLNVDLSGDAPTPDAPTHHAETPSGHIFGLAKVLDERPTPGTDFDAREEYPEELFRLPIPNEVFGRMGDLSGVATRLLFVLIRDAYGYDPGRGGWTCKQGYATRGDLSAATRSGLAMNPNSFTRAARELKRARMVELKGGGESRSALKLRLLLDVPEKRFTWIPAKLIEAHGWISHSAWKVLLQVYAATWGQTAREAREGGSTVVHDAWARLTTAELADRCDLSVATVRSCIQTLTRLGALERDRPSRGYAWRYRPSPPDPKHSFFQNRGGHISYKSCNPNSRTRANPRADDTTGRQSQPEYAHSWDAIEEKFATGERDESQRPGGAVPERGVPDSFGDTEQGLYDILTSESGFDLPRGWTIRMLRGRDVEVVRRTLRAYQKRKEQGGIRNPPGWIRAALEKSWFAPTEAEKQGGNTNRRGETTHTTPLGHVFDRISEESGFPMPETGTGGYDRKREEGGDLPATGQEAAGSGHPAQANPAHPGTPERRDHRRPAHSDPPSKADTEKAVGVTHSKLRDLVEALGRPRVGTWNCHQRDGGPNLFVPNEKLAEWARARKDRPGASDRFKKAARTVVALWKDSCTTQG